MTEDEMVRWHYRLDGHEFEQTQGDSEVQGSLACCSPLGGKELDITEETLHTQHIWLYNHVLIYQFYIFDMRERNFSSYNHFLLHLFHV